MVLIIMRVKSAEEEELDTYQLKGVPQVFFPTNEKKGGI